MVVHSDPRTAPRPASRRKEKEQRQECTPSALTDEAVDEVDRMRLVDEMLSPADAAQFRTQLANPRNSYLNLLRPHSRKLGEKFAARDGSMKQFASLRLSYFDYKRQLAKDRFYTRSLCRTQLEDNRVVCVVTLQRGNHMISQGYTYGSNVVLMPEEAIYLLDRGRIDIVHEGRRLSVQEAIAVLCHGELAMETLQLFIHLKRLGYVVRRFSHPVKSSLIDSLTPETPAAANVQPRTREELTKSDQSVFDKTIAFGVPERAPSTEKRGPTQPLLSPATFASGASLADALKQAALVQSRHPFSLVGTRPSTASNLTDNQRRKILGFADTRLHFIQFDVYKPQQAFRKSAPGAPDFRVVVCKYSDPPPSFSRLQELACLSYPVPIKYAVLSGNSLSFYGFVNTILPRMSLEASVQVKPRASQVPSSSETIPSAPACQASSVAFIL
ncbi:hypothetical protein, variant [Capsaspora owczarzaki ATCC 30864]|nr:hypothetical protein, variant [Capsaspora owczarzaki ATCC 30864]